MSRPTTLFERNLATRKDFSLKLLSPLSLNNIRPKPSVTKLSPLTICFLVSPKDIRDVRKSYEPADCKTSHFLIRRLQQRIVISVKEAKISEMKSNKRCLRR